MALTYKKIERKPQIFLRLTGVAINDFRKITEKVSEDWNKIENQKKGHGRTSNLKTLEDKILALLIYYRTYITHEFIGFLMGLHNSNICRLFKILEPLLANKVTIKKDKALTPEKIIKIITDVTEQPTQRPKKKQRKYYSGKKKRHTIKTEIVVEEHGRILSISRMAPGKRHDFRIRKEGKPLPINSEKYADSGYQGLQKICAHVHLPFKGSKKNPLTREQKKHNHDLASFRIRVEHKIRDLKIFKILRDTYRSFQKKHNLRFNIIAGIVNLQHGF